MDSSPTSFPFLYHQRIVWERHKQRTSLPWVHLMPLQLSARVKFTCAFGTINGIPLAQSCLTIQVQLVILWEHCLLCKEGAPASIRSSSSNPSARPNQAPRRLQVVDVCLPSSSIKSTTQPFSAHYVILLAYGFLVSNCARQLDKVTWDVVGCVVVCRMRYQLT